MADTGLLSGVLQGLTSGLNTYSAESARKKQERQQQQMLAAQGYDVDEEGNVKPGSGLLEKQQLERDLLKKKAGEDQYDQEYKQAQTKKALAEAAFLQGNKGKDSDLERRYTEAKIEGLIGKNNKEPKTTADQAKAAGFGKRLEQAEGIFADLEKTGYDRSSRVEDLKSRFAPGELKGENLVSQNQAERNFINAVLRRESGAAISPSEFSSGEQQYFIRPGDTDKIKAQKRANRLQVAESLKAEAGAAYGKVPLIEGSGGYKPDPSSAPKVPVGNAPPPPPQFTPDVLTYAQQHGISPDQAQAIKIQRGGR